VGQTGDSRQGRIRFERTEMGAKTCRTSEEYKDAPVKGACERHWAGQVGTSFAEGLLPILCGR
jgi:hypothetical protein